MFLACHKNILLLILPTTGPCLSSLKTYIISLPYLKSKRNNLFEETQKNLWNVYINKRLHGINVLDFSVVDELLKILIRF